jgi:hypothetical protein
MGRGRGAVRLSGYSRISESDINCHDSQTRASVLGLKTVPLNPVDFIQK